MIESNHPIHSNPALYGLVESYVSAYILVKAGDTNIQKVKALLLEIPEVRLAHQTTGPTDIVIYLEASSLGKIQNILDTSIRQLMDVNMIASTTTELVLQNSSGVGYSTRNTRASFYKAWLFITLGSGGKHELLLKEVLKIPIVTNAHVVLGKADIIALVESNNIKDIVNLLDRDLKEFEQIKNTNTKIVIDDYVK